MSELSIEPMTRAHIPDVIRIEEELFDSPWSEGMFRQEVRDRFLSRPMVGLVGGEVVAYMIAWFIRNEVHLLNIAVTREHQRKGFARTLLRHLIEVASSERRASITLEVRSGNIRAIRLYEGHGFYAVGRRPRYYQDNGEDAIVMALDLEPPGGEG
jgi:ribosomal-protein-alanine N-acetyltransferase